MPHLDPQALDDVLKRDEDRFLEEWKQLLRFPSVSTDPQHAPDCLACACWLRDHLQGIAFETELVETTGRPLVLGLRQGRSDLPSVLYYGHYDVQPVDPLEEWNSDPFEPVLKDGRLYARGAEDNKGQFFYGLKAIETLVLAGNELPTITVLLEGEEECGSKGLAGALPGLRDRLRSDVLLVTDTAAASSGQPAIIAGLRGIVHLTVTLSGPNRDLHSGVHGGAAPNPAREMAALVAALHDSEGRIAVPGYEDGVEMPSPEERRLAAESAVDPETYRRETGVPPVSGDKRFTPAERVGFRSSIDVNGIHSGYGGEGLKTIIPARAVAKLSSRLVPGQDPQWCLDAIVEQLRRHCPEGLQLEIPEQEIGGSGFRLDCDSQLVARAARVLAQLDPRGAVFLWEGASVPIVSALRETSGAEPLLVGFGREEDNIHASNESFSLEQFRSGFRYMALMLQELSSAP